MHDYFSPIYTATDHANPPSVIIFPSAYQQSGIPSLLTGGKIAGMRMVEGYEDGTFPPLANLSRAEAAALIYRLKDWLANL
jgi:hypothetical protein